MSKSIKFFTKIVSLVLCFFVCMTGFSACKKSDKNNDNTYAIVGYVYDELGRPVEDVQISTSFSTAKTNKSGRFSFEGINGQVVLTASKTGYKFAELSKTVKSNKDDANFVAYQEYTVKGVAHNNSVAVANANVIATSLSGSYYTQTDENGNFSISGVAGKTNISCEIDNLQFYNTTASIEAPSVQINTTSSLKINLETEDSNIDVSKVKVFVDDHEIVVTSSEVVIGEIKCGSSVRIESDFYHFDKPTTFIVKTLNQVENFKLSEIYSVSGTVKSGNVPMKDVQILINGKQLALTDANGRFEIADVSGEKVISAVHPGFVFSSANVNKSNSVVNILGTKSVFVSVEKDFNNGSNILFGEASAALVGGRYKISGVALGDNILCSSEGYVFDNSTISVGAENYYTVNAFAKYDAIVSVDGDFDYELLLDGEVVEEDELVGLSGSHRISARYSNYNFSEVIVSASNVLANLTYEIPYNVVLTVKSNERILEEAVFKINGDVIGEADINGTIRLENLVGRKSITISAEGYNDETITVDTETETIVNLTYDVDGYVVSGENAIIDAKVSAGEINVYTNDEGYFKISGISGGQIISVEKQGYAFEEKTAVKQKSVTINGSYTVLVNVVVDGSQNIKNYSLSLRSNETSESEVQVVNAEGNIFSGLIGSYILEIKSTQVGEGAVNVSEFNPGYYSITEPCVRNFSSSGFQVSGVVKTGDIPIVGAKVEAVGKGSSSYTYTNADGEYLFELLTEESEIKVSKTGYSFGSSVIVSETNEEVNFNATYTASGRVLIGPVGVSGVVVSNKATGEILATTDENGNYIIYGISGQIEITFEKEGFVFGETQNVSSCEINATTSKVKVVVQAKSGTIDVVNFDTYVNGVIHTGELVVDVGDVITLSKEGYSFGSVTVESTPKTYTVQATYTISGSVTSKDVAVENFEIFVNGTKVYGVVTLDTFEISGLSGENTIEVKKSGLTFNAQTVSGYESEIVFNGTYGISGKIWVGSKALSGVVVTLVNGINTAVTTGENGEFSFTGISGNFDLQFAKEGYGFTSLTNKFGEQVFTVNASYSISGVVKSGSLFVKGATVLLGTGTETIAEVVTDENGNFVFTNVTDQVNLTIKKSGYTAQSIEGISDLSTNNVVNLKYSFTIMFDVSGVTVYIKRNGGQEEKFATLTGKTVTLTNLEGSNVLRFELGTSAFTRNNIEIKEPAKTALEIQVTQVYNITGTVTSGGFGVAGLKISSAVDGAYVVTDQNGEYTFNGVKKGQITIGGDGVLDFESKTVNKDGVYNFSLTSHEFAYYLFANAMKKADESPYVQVEGSGPVSGTAAGISTTQNAYSVYKRDANKNVIRKNQNVGEIISGVDPNVSLAALYLYTAGNEYDKVSNPKLWYEHLSGSGNTTHTYTNSNIYAFETSSGAKNGFKDVYGANPITDYVPYVINKNTISNSATVSEVNSRYEFTFTLKGSEQSGYGVQIAKLGPSGTTFDKFSSISLKITVTKDGWISSIYAVDKYTINKKVLGINTTVTCESKITYTFTNYTNNDITTDVMASLVVNKTNKASAQSYALIDNEKYDVVSQVIYG